MKKLIALVALVACSISCKNPVSVILYAQSFPTTVQGSVDPNPASDNVVSYKYLLNGVVVATLPATSCSATACTASLPIPAAGNFTFTVVASNLKLSTDPTSLEDSDPSTALAFSVNLKPGTPKNNKIGQ